MNFFFLKKDKERRRGKPTLCKCNESKTIKNTALEIVFSFRSSRETNQPKILKNYMY
jgi:hypothetical protein